MNGKAALLKKIINRTLWLILTMFILSVGVFYLARLAPGDPLQSFYGDATESMTAKELEAARVRLGLDGPIYIQYIKWISNAFQGDFGLSLKYKTPALEVIAPLIGNTLILGGTAYILVFMLATLLALFCAMNEDTLIDRIICKVGTAAYYIPPFWLGVVLVLIFSINLNWLPSSGAYDIGLSGDILNRIQHMILPLIVMILSHLWYYAYMIRNKLLDEVRKDYVLLAKSKGCTKSEIVFKHCFRNVAPTIVSIMAISIPHVLSGTYIAESVNQHPVGTGRYKFVKWDKAGGMISLVRNEKYYAKIPKIKKVVYKTVAVESTKALMLQSGQADLAWLNAKYAKRFRGKAGFKNYDFKTADYRAISPDFKTDFWVKNKDSIGVLNYAIDKKAIVKSVLNSQGYIAYSPIQLSAFGGNKAANIYSYNLPKFAKAMKKLGWTKGSDGIYKRNGQKFHFTIQVRDYEEERVDIANIVAKQLKKAGVEMKIALVTKFDWNAGYNGFLAGYAAEFDPDQSYQQFVTNGSSNTMKYSNPVIDDLLTKARHTKDVARRKTLYGQFEVAFTKEPASVLIAYLHGNYVGINGLKGLNTARVLGHHAVGVMWNIEDWTLSKK